MSLRTPIWPYSLALSLLLLLALVATHAWDRTSQQFATPPASGDTAISTNGSTIDSGDGATTVLPVPVQTADLVSNSKYRTAARTAALPESDSSFGMDQTARAALPLDLVDQKSAAVPNLADLHRDVSLVGESLASGLSATVRAFEIHPQPKQHSANIAAARNDENQTAPAVASLEKPVASSRSPDAPIRIEPISPLRSEQSIGQQSIGIEKLATQPSDSQAEAHAWPAPKSLLDALTALAQLDDADASEWADEVRSQIEVLDGLQGRDVRRAESLLDQLRQAAERGGTIAEHERNVEKGFAIRRVQYALVRRLDVWDVVCTQRKSQLAATAARPMNRRRMELALADVNSLAERNGGMAGLREHLMIDKLSELSRGDAESAADERRHIAREVLGRIAERRQANGRLMPDDQPIAELGRQLRPWAADAIQAPAQSEELLAMVEQFEASGSLGDARQLAELRSQLAHSQSAADQELARRIEVHYRNANVRIVLSADLINRLMPEQGPVDSPVNETILGTPVYGQSTTSTSLRVRLLPSQSSWQIAFEALGNVDSQTSSTVGPVTFMNRGAAQFYVRKRIVVDADGFHSEPAAAAVSTNSAVNGLQTQYDGIPIVRSWVRNYAMSQRQQMEVQANQEAQEKIRQSACWRVDSQLQPRLTGVEQNYRDQVLAPIKKLELKPTIATLETSEKRLTLRSRLAGDDQLSAYTPRPDAPGDSMASMQIHESAINNVLDHLELAGKKFTLPQLCTYLNKRLSRQGKLPDDLPQGVVITFADSEPMRIRCVNGKIELAIRIAEIRQGKRRWHDFEIRASYRPDAHGMVAELGRDGSIELGGLYKGKTELALRGIFSKVLPRDRKIDLMPSFLSQVKRLASLQVTQLVVADGWLGLAIGPSAPTAARTRPVRRF